MSDIQAAFRSHQYWPTGADYICSCGWKGHNPPKHVIEEVLLYQGLRSEWPHAKHRKSELTEAMTHPLSEPRKNRRITVSVAGFRDKLAKLLGAYT
jgi:hypothetical protein